MRRVIDPSLSTLIEGAGAGLIFISAYVPWVTTLALVASVPVRGIDTDYGRIVVLIPLAVYALMAWRWYARDARWVHAAIAALGILLIALTVGYAVRVQRNLERARESIAREGQIPGAVDLRFDIGMYLAGSGCVALTGGGLFGLVSSRRSSGAA